MVFRVIWEKLNEKLKRNVHIDYFYFNTFCRLDHAICDILRGVPEKESHSYMTKFQGHSGNCFAELQIVVELGNLVPRNNLVLQKVFEALRY